MGETMPKSDPLKKLLGAFGGIGGGAAGGGQRGNENILQDGTLWQQVVGLKNEADLLVAYSGELRLGEVREFLSVQLDAAASGGVERAEDVEQRAFAGAGGTNNREGIAALDNERDAAKHRHGIAVRTFVLFMNVLKLENDRVT